MNLNKYQQLAARTIPNKNDDTLEINFLLGLAGETGELLDYVKKVWFHDHELDEQKLKSELGDILWYVAGLAGLAEFTLQDIAEYNIEKLKKRYPDGFDPEKSINRDTSL